eukprot:TRINITY_DN2394_c1_g3_i2.p2 TRINITY_DN2394_c1_g3~~TRINITY_DN2394_c1_g3_i2.p2  ORF type:complete len:158 (-),score=31.73 TRINITY_DN2394_c1_g3_i2:573-1046(-)
MDGCCECDQEEKDDHKNAHFDEKKKELLVGVAAMPFSIFQRTLRPRAVYKNENECECDVCYMWREKLGQFGGDVNGMTCDQLEQGLEDLRKYATVSCEELIHKGRKMFELGRMLLELLCGPGGEGERDWDRVDNAVKMMGKGVFLDVDAVWSERGKG